MKVQHLSQLSPGSDRDVAVGPASAPVPHVARRVPRSSNRLRWVRGRGDSTTPPDLSRADWGNRPIADMENEMDLGAAEKRENCQLSVWTRHEVHRFDIWILDGGTWLRPNDDMAQSQRLLRDRITGPMGSKKCLHPLSHGTWR